MKIIRLQVEGFKRLVAVDITPEGDLVEVRGNNAEGKSSVLDSIMAALGGASAAPIKPVRTGEEYAIIKADLGDLKVTRYFDKDGTDRLKVENAEGAVYQQPQTMLDALVGRIAFDPLAFARMNPKEQAIELRRIVPLKVDLDALAKADKADRDARRDINRDGKALVARRDAINISGIIPERPDRDAISAELTTAATKNSAIERERAAREARAAENNAAKRYTDSFVTRAEQIRREIERLTAEAEKCDRDAAENEAVRERVAAELAALPPLDEPVDIEDAARRLEQADRDLALLARVDQRKALDAEIEAKRAESEALTTRLAERDKVREKALAEAEMPIEGLGFATFEEDGDLLVSYQGEPFSQASGAQQLRVSMALAMAANPKLRVMTIKDGSLLDANGLALVRELAKAGDYQVWLEGVGDGGVGIIMEGGKVRGAADPEPIPAPKRRKAKGEGDSAVEGEQAEEGAPIAQAEAQAEPPAPSRRPRPQAMTEFTSKPLGGLFGDDKA